MLFSFMYTVDKWTIWNTFVKLTLTLKDKRKRKVRKGDTHKCVKERSRYAGSMAGYMLK